MVSTRIKKFQLKEVQRKSKPSPLALIDYKTPTPKYHEPEDSTARFKTVVQRGACENEYFIMYKLVEFRGKKFWEYVDCLRRL